MRPDDDYGDEGARLERLDRLLEESGTDDAAWDKSSLDPLRKTLGPQFAELEELAEVERALHAFMDPRDSVRLPRNLGGWRLLRELGRGGMGVVYEAEHERTGQRVALKVLRMGFVGRADARARFRREAEALARVHHDHVVDFLEAGEEDDQPFYTMSLVEGRSLDRVLAAKDRPDLGAMCRGLANVCDALQDLHDAGLVHRDLKPSNIMVAPDGRMVLADFGLATGDDFLTLTRTGDALGTPSYMAPEQVLGKRDEVDARTDVYGMGATLYTVLTGRTPFTGSDAREQAFAILRERPAPPHTHDPAVPRSCERIAMKALEKERDDRYPSAAALRDDLLAFADGRAVTGRPVSAPTRGVRAAGRHPLLLLATVAVLALAGFLLFRTAPGVLDLEVAPIADLFVDGNPHGRVPAHRVSLEPGVRTLVLRPVDERFLPYEQVLEVEEGGDYRLRVLLKPKDANDWKSVAELAGVLGIAFERPARPTTRRAGRTPDVQLVFPRGRVRIEDLEDLSLRIHLHGGTFESPARIVFRRGDEVVGSIEGWMPETSRSDVQIPAALIAALGDAGPVSWSLEREGHEPLFADLDLAQDEGIEADLAAIDEAIDAGALRATLRARRLLNEGYALAAWQTVERVAEEERSLLLLALQKEALESMFPDEAERVVSEPWTYLLHQIEATRFSYADRALVFGPEDE